MPLTARSSARRRRKTTNEKLPERPGESTSAQVMAPTRMKLRVRRRDGAGVAGGGQPEEDEERSREGGGRSGVGRRKNTCNTPTAATAGSSPPTSSASASARAAVVAAEEASPDSKCPICLDRFNNLAYLDRCLHRFCFPCIQEWSHNKAECPLCKQPFASILHSVRAEDDFKEYTLRPAPANSSVAATVAMVAAMASAARSDHQMRLMLRRHRVAEGGETTARRRRRERGGRGGGSRRTGVWEWYLDSPPLPLPPLPHHPTISPVVAEDSGEGEDVEQQRMRTTDLAERGVIFEGLTGLGGAVAAAPNDRATRRLMTRLAARQRLQREGGTVRRLRERETVAFRRALYRCGIRVRGVAGISGNQGQQCDITAESFRRNPAQLNRLRPWLRRELTVLYGAHGTLVDIVQRIIMAQLARHGLEDTPTIEEELRPFLLARTDHFLHELVSFARSPISLEIYDLQAVYEPPATTLELDRTSSPSDSSSVIAISEGEEGGGRARGRSEEGLQGRPGGAHADVIPTGSCLSMSAWDDETPGPSYSTAEPSCSLNPLTFSPALQGVANEEGGERREEEGEEECLIVGYKKPIAERTPELVQLSSDTEEEEDKEKEEEKTAKKLPPLSSTTPPLSYLPTIPPSTSRAYQEEQDDKPKEKDGEAGGRCSRARSWSGSSGRSQGAVCALGPSERQLESWRDRKQSGSDVLKEKRRRRRRKKRRRGRERSGTLYNPNRSIYPPMMRPRSRSPSPFHTSVDSGSPLPPSPPDSSGEYHCSPLTSSVSSPSHSTSSSSSPLCSSPQPPSSPPPQTPPTPSLSPGNTHHREKPGGKRKYKSRHLDSNDRDPTWRSSSGHRREKRREKGEKERRRRRRGRDGGRRRERQRREAHRESSSYCGESSSSRRCREDRSPSVEIIYEGTIASDAAQPPARKRRRRHPRKMPHSSSPVIITLDSDSSHSDVNNKRSNSSSSSSPLSSQQTVDFSDLPPLPLVHSTGVGGALDAEIGELPVDILDRGSDGSEMDPVGQSGAMDPIAIDNSDNSDRDVDVENVEESGSLLGCNRGPIRKAKTDGTPATTSVDGGSQQTGNDDAAPTMTDPCTRNSEVSTSDSLLLTSILNELKGIAAPKCDLPSNLERSCSPESRRRHFLGLRESSRAHPDQDGRSAETRCPAGDLPGERQINDVRDQNLGTVLPTCHTSAPFPPPLQQVKECRFRGEGADIPPLLRRASPIRSYNRNTPPPLKHKDVGSPRLSPLSPADLHSLHTPADIDPAGVSPPLDLNSNPTVSHADSRLAPEPRDNQTTPAISMPKKHSTSALALRGELAPTSSNPAIDTHSSGLLAHIDSHPSSPIRVRGFPTGLHSTSHRPPIDPHSSSGPEKSLSTDCLPHVDFLNNFHSPKLHSSHHNTKEIPSSGLRASPVNLHPVNSLSPVDFHSTKTGWSKGKPANTDSTSGGCRNKTLTVAPVNLHLSGSVSARGTQAGGVFSGVDFNNASPAVFGSSLDSRTQNPSAPADSHSSDKRENLSQRLDISSVPTPALGSSLSPIDSHPRSPKSNIDLRPPSVASEGPTEREASFVANHDKSPWGHPPPVDLNCAHPLLSANFHSSHFLTTTTDGHFNHAALPSPAFHASHRKCGSRSEPTIESHSKHHRSTDLGSKHSLYVDASCDPLFPVAARSAQDPPVDAQSQRDCQLDADNRITSPPPPVESRWDPDSPVDQCSAGGVWATHAHPTT